MTRAICLWMAWCALALAHAQAQSTVELNVLATDPAPDALLARQQPFFVRFELKSAAPATVTVSGLNKGKSVIDAGGTGAPAMLPAGGGIGVVSFFHWGEQPTRIDEVRLTINDSSSGATINEYAFPAALTWLTDDPPLREPAAWVGEWRQAQLASNKQTTRKAESVAEQTTGPGVWVALAGGAMLVAMTIARSRRRASPADDDEARR